MKLWDTVKRTARYNYLRVMRLNMSTHSIAMGMAVGIFAGCLPILPFQTAVAAALAVIFRGSIVAACAGTWISNPLNWVPFYGACFWIGKLILPLDVSFDPNNLELEQMLNQGWNLVAVMMTGGLVMAVPSTFIAYLLTFKGVQRFRQRRMIRLIRKYKAKQESEAADSQG